MIGKEDMFNKLVLKSVHIPPTLNAVIHMRINATNPMVSICNYVLLVMPSSRILSLSTVACARPTPLAFADRRGNKASINRVFVAERASRRDLRVVSNSSSLADAIFLIVDIQTTSYPMRLRGLWHTYRWPDERRVQS